jgi:hypothetical protein
MGTIQKTRNISILVLFISIFLFSSIIWAGSMATYSLVRYVYGNAGNFGFTPNSTTPKYAFGGTLGESVIFSSVGTCKVLDGSGTPVQENIDGWWGFWPTLWSLPKPFDRVLNTRALWKLDEGYGPLSVDSSCYLLGQEDRNDLIIGEDDQSPRWITDSPDPARPNDPTALFGAALLFDGYNDHAESFFDMPDLSLNQAFSAELWFLLEPEKLPLAQEATFISQLNYNEKRGWKLSLVIYGRKLSIRYAFYAVDTYGNPNYTEDEIALYNIDSFWHHVCLIRNPMTHGISIYFDFDEYRFDYGPLSGIIRTDEQVIVGAHQINTQGQVAGFFRGAIDDIRITDYPIDEREIAFDKSAAIPNCVVTPTCTMLPARTGNGLANRILIGFLYCGPFLVVCWFRRLSRRI